MGFPVPQELATYTGFKEVYITGGHDVIPHNQDSACCSTSGQAEGIGPDFSQIEVVNAVDSQPPSCVLAEPGTSRNASTTNDENQTNNLVKTMNTNSSDHDAHLLRTEQDEYDVPDKETKKLYLKCKMTKEGLYQKIPFVEGSYLQKFRVHMVTTKGIGANHADNVIAILRRILFGRGGDEVDGILDIEWVMSYINRCVDQGLTSQSVKNYYQACENFLEFIKYETNVCLNNQDMKTKLCDVINAYQYSDKKLKKTILSEKNAKKAMENNTKMIRRITLIHTELNSSKMKDSVTKALDELQKCERILGNPIAVNKFVYVRRYLTCIILINHCQRPGIAQNMTINEYIRGRDTEGESYTVNVKKHKTSSTEPGTIALSYFEKQLFERYITEVRSRIARELKTPVEPFVFISHEGKRIKASQEPRRLLKGLKLPGVTSTEMRKMLYTCNLIVHAEDRTNLAKYLKHLPSTATTSYERQTDEAAAKNAERISNVFESTTEYFSVKQTLVTDAEIDVNSKFYTNKEIKQKVLSEFKIKLSDHQIGLIKSAWYRKRNINRATEIVHRFRRRKDLTRKDIETAFKSESWKVNDYLVDVTISMWNKSRKYENLKRLKPVKHNIPDETLVVGKCDTKKLGTGLCTLRPVQKGDILCEYKGTLMSHKEGMEKYNTLPNADKWYLLFFKYNDKKYCIDATEDDGSLGRLINHSKKNANVEPKVIKENNVIKVVMVAKCDLPIGKELRFDYNDPKSGLEWMKNS